MYAVETFLYGLLVTCLMRLEPSSGLGGNLNIYFRTLNTNYNKQILQYFEAHLVERNGRNVLHVEFEFIKQADRVNATLVAKLPRVNKEGVKVLNVGADVCEALKPSYVYTNMIVKVVVYGLRYGNSTLPEICPFLAKRRYVSDQFYLHPEMFPGLLPEMSVTINFTLLVPKGAVFSVAGLMDFVRE